MTTLIDVKCEQCGADLRVSENATIAKCPYCNYFTQLKEVKETEERYLLTVNHQIEDLEKLLVGDLLKVPTVPSSIRNSIQIINAKLVYEPYFVSTVHGNMKWRGEGRSANYSFSYEGGYRNISFYLKPEAGVFDDFQIFVQYAGNRREDVFQNYLLSTEGKEFFAESTVSSRGGEIEKEAFDFSQAGERSVGFLRNKQLNLLNQEIQKVQDKEEKYRLLNNELIYVPFWIVDFAYKKGAKTKKAIVDASSGDTLILEIPKGRLFIMTLFFSVFIYSMLIGLTFLFDPTLLIDISNDKLPLGVRFTGPIFLIIFVGLLIQTMTYLLRSTFKERRL